MKLNVRAKRIDLTDELQSLVERRIYFALSRFGPRISSVSVLVEDINGERAGIDKRCQILIKLDRVEELKVEATEADIEPAISSAAERAGRVVQRKVELRRSPRRASSRFEEPDQPQYDTIPRD